jgi:ABC-type multidrug transport system ATPase subunit
MANNRNSSNKQQYGKYPYSATAMRPNNHQDRSSGLGIEAINLRKEKGDKTNYLQNVSIEIPVGQFVAIVGESGCGKTTLMKALNGLDPATEGFVYIVEKGKKYDLYEYYDSFRNRLGYVPQEDIIHRELTVDEALKYAAKLRMPDSTSEDKCESRINEVLKVLDLGDKKRQQIATLSGGERKRVSIGVELLSDPSILFLDEATSGLDPFHEAQLMDFLRTLSKQKDKPTTVILVTHATQNITKCDLVAFMAKEHDNPSDKRPTKKNASGYMVYYGPPENAKRVKFNVSNFDEIYAKLEDKKDGWKNNYVELPRIGSSTEKRKLPSPARTNNSPVGQLLTLLQRDINVLIHDRISLILMLLVAPLAGMLNSTFWRYGLFSPNGGPAGGDAELAITNLFMAAIICCITGAISSMREVVKEKDIYQRERMVVLQIGPYVFSKTIIAIILSIYQATIFILILKLAGGWPDTISITLQAYLTLFLATFAGMMQGLLVSCISPNQNVAPLLLIIVLVFQLIFGGIIPDRDRGPIINKLSMAFVSITTTKWSFESMVTLSGMGKCIALDPCWQFPKDERGKLSEQYKTDSCACMGPKLFEKCCFPGIREYYSQSITEHEPSKPAKPKDPGDPPPQPNEPLRSNYKSSRDWTDAWQQYIDDTKSWAKDMDDYYSKVKSYQDQLKNYEKDMDKYTDAYKNWQENRSQAIGKAEGLINTMNQNYGHAFNVNIIGHWGILSSIIGLIFLLILAIQKLKDQF